MPRVPLMSRRIAGLQLDCLLVFRLGGLPVPAIKVQSESERGVGLAEAIVQCQRLGRIRPGFGESILRRNYPIFPIARQCVGVSQARICLGVGWIRLDRTIEILNGALQPISGSLVQKVPSFEVGLISFRVHCLRVLKRRLFLSVQGGPDLLGDGASYLVLEREDIPNISFIALGPQVLVGKEIEKHRLCAEPEPSYYKALSHSV